MFQIQNDQNTEILKLSRPKKCMIVIFAIRAKKNLIIFPFESTHVQMAQQNDAKTIRFFFRSVGSIVNGGGVSYGRRLFQFATSFFGSFSRYLFLRIAFSNFLQLQSK